MAPVGMTMKFETGSLASRYSNGFSSRDFFNDRAVRPTVTVAMIGQEFQGRAERGQFGNFAFDF